MFYTFSPTAAGLASATSSGTWNGQAFSVALQGSGEAASSGVDFLRPVRPFPAFNRVFAGQIIPLKFRLGANLGLDILAPGSPASGTIECASTEPISPDQPTRSLGHLGLLYNRHTGTYIYLWKTRRDWAGTCRQVVLTLTDGTVLRANFRFKHFPSGHHRQPWDDGD
jgi:hypothetical protein